MKKWLYPSLAGTVTFIIHAAYSIQPVMQIASRFPQSSIPSALIMALSGYFRNLDFMIGLSYTLSAAFTVFAFLRLRQGQAKGVAGMLGGATMMGLLYYMGCFLLGCCGSPMLVVYLNLFGASFLGFTKPIMLALTTISIGIGYFWMEKKAKTTECGCADGSCNKVGQ